MHNHDHYAAQTVAAKAHDSRIVSHNNDNDKLLSIAMGMAMAMAMTNIVEEDDNIVPSIANNNSLASSDSQSSVFSMASSSTTDSFAITTGTEMTTGTSSSSMGRRRIFPKYWQKNPEQPRSPLIQHYPARSGGGSVGGSVDGLLSSPISFTSPIQQREYVSPASILEQQDLSQTNKIININNNNTMLSASPSRRSIFGAASPSLLGLLSSHDENEGSNSSSNNNTDNNNSNSNINLDLDLDLERFFSKHEHMKILSSSLDTTSSLSSTAGSTLLLKQRPRSYSCSDALFSISAARNTITNNKRTHPLVSCLKRSKSTTITSTSRMITTITDTNKPLSDSTQRPSVTFHSQIEIFAFERTNSYEGASTCTDGSWTDLFDR
jgi:hypothetical protein